MLICAAFDDCPWRSRLEPIPPPSPGKRRLYILAQGAQIGVFEDPEQARLNRGPLRDLSATGISAFRTYPHRARDHLFFDDGRPAGLVRSGCFREVYESRMVSNVVPCI